MKDFDCIIQQFETEWDTNGFFDRVRNGEYDQQRAQEILEILRTISIGEDELLPKRLVSLLWYLPSFLGWQSERVAKRNGDMVAYQKFVTEIFNTLEEILGVP